MMMNKPPNRPPNRPPFRPPNINWNYLNITLVPFSLGVGLMTMIYALDQPKPLNFILTSEKIYIPQKDIKWIEDSGDCFYLCTKDHGCFTSHKIEDKWKICNDLPSYDEIKAITKKN